jgi:hypothetical protein
MSRNKHYQTLPILARYESCCSDFEQLQQAATGSVFETRIREQHGRFQVWGANVRIRGKGSLDTNLRWSTNLQADVAEMFDELHAIVQECKYIVSFRLFKNSKHQ